MLPGALKHTNRFSFTLRINYRRLCLTSIYSAFYGRCGHKKPHTGEHTAGGVCPSVQSAKLYHGSHLEYKTSPAVRTRANICC